MDLGLFLFQNALNSGGVPLQKGSSDAGDKPYQTVLEPGGRPPEAQGAPDLAHVT